MPPAGVAVIRASCSAFVHNHHAPLGVIHSQQLDGPSGQSHVIVDARSFAGVVEAGMSAGWSAIYGASADGSEEQASAARTEAAS